MRTSDRHESRGRLIRRGDRSAPVTFLHGRGDEPDPFTSQHQQIDQSYDSTGVMGTRMLARRARVARSRKPRRSRRDQRCARPSKQYDTADIQTENVKVLPVGDRGCIMDERKGLRCAYAHCQEPISKKAYILGEVYDEDDDEEEFNLSPSDDSNCRVFRKAFFYHTTGECKKAFDQNSKSLMRKSRGIDPESTIEYGWYEAKVMAKRDPKDWAPPKKPTLEML